MLRGLLLIWALFILYSCMEPLPEEPSPNMNSRSLRTVKVSVRHIYEHNPVVRDSMVPDVEAKLFLNETDRINDIAWDGVQYTDSSGVAVFPGRDDDYYFVRASHPVLGVKEGEVKTPPGTISFLEILYY